MKNNSFTSIIHRLFAVSAALILLMVQSTGCSKEDPEEHGILDISDVVLLDQIYTSIGSEVSISGRGFKSGDVVVLRPVLTGSAEYTAPAVLVTSTEIVFVVPDGLTSGEYKVYVSRNGQNLLLGRTTINLLSDIPDKAGMNIKGIVTCNGEPVTGVVVSDGSEVTRTDAEGIYYLASDKKNGYVFISVPSGYEVDHSGTTPRFFGYLNQSASTVEQRDFALAKCDNSHHRVVVFTDVHLARRVSDRSQFQSGFLREMTDYLKSCRADNIPVYGIALGDLAWDQYWYENDYDLNDYQNDLKSLDFPVFSAPGNHDNDPTVANDDFAAAGPFRQIIGPTDFSFNIGNVHYILLDNVVYENPNGIDGTHSYSVRLTDEKLEWLRKDLATVDKQTPVFVGMHVPLHKTPTLDDTGRTTTSYNMEDAERFVECLEGYDVNILTGHTHYNFNITKSERLREHNIAAVCATWWWTGHTDYAGNHICRDGSPGGYKIFEATGSDVRWYYKSIGKDAGYQFRTYDLNECLLEKSDFCPSASDSDFAKYAFGYDRANDNNEVLINVFDWADDWKIEVTDLSDDSSLAVQRVRTHDPLHVISYNMRKLDKKSAMTFPTSYSAHMFKVKARTASSSLRIVVTDGFENHYEQIMERPKALSFAME